MSNINKILKILNKYNTAKECVEDCKKFVSNAIECISKFRNCEEKQIFLSWANSHAKFERTNWPEE
jgi:hypothetical protein